MTGSGFLWVAVLAVAAAVPSSLVAQNSPAAPIQPSATSRAVEPPGPPIPLGPHASVTIEAAEGLPTHTVYRPADLSASLGHVANPGHPEVQAAIEDAIQRITRAGKAAGILTPDEAQARRYLELGATFVAVGLDNNLLAKATSALAAKFKTSATALPPSKTY